jgi:hypothetical protein
MNRVLWNVGIGLVFLVGGLTGKLVLLGTNSGPAAAVFGAALIGFGAYQYAKSTGRL